MKPKCPLCDKDLPEYKGGRPAKYCSNACKQRAYRSRSGMDIPVEMRKARRWVRAAGKRPVAMAGGPASSTDPATWGPFEGRGREFGFMLGGGFGCIDLDHCVRDGKVAGWARRVLDACPGGFVELSVSGTGLHLFGWLPEQPGRRLVVPGGGGVEVYSRARFIRMTGRAFRKGGLVDLAPALSAI